MTKKDLRTGMVVETRGGDHYLVVKDAVSECECGDYFLNLEGGFNRISEYNDDLTCKSYYDIVKVYKAYAPGSMLDENPTEYATLLWERPTYYNGKVVCTVNEVGYTRGKIYEYVDGFLTDDDGEKRPIGGHAVTDLSQYQPGWFIEVVE